MATTGTNEPLGISPERDKAVRLFTYLMELCALRTTQVRDVAAYDQLFWFHNLPHHKLCQCTLWHLADPLIPAPEQNPDLWIEVRKPKLKSPPELPDELEPWIKDEELDKSSLTEPGFYEQIPLSALQEDSAGTDPTTLASINNYPQVFDMWVDYVEAKWKPWASEDRELQKVQKAYNQLFNIYQRQEKLGEQYEVIIGAGLLSWKSPNSGQIKRHIIAIQARIEFDRIRGVLSVGATLDGPQPTLECSMLETADRPNPSDLNNIGNDVNELDGDPWNIVALERVLRGFANALPINGDYISSFEINDRSSEKPVVILGPALILRKRTRRTFEDFYRQIIDQIKGGEEVPENIRRIIAIVDDLSDEKLEGGEIEPGPATPKISESELYFPLPANEEQKKIVQKVEHHRGVLVQGPPGTGKSHTIANLICHYLAIGKRILVTSETPRALEVLRKMLPREIEELCVVWLGSGPDSQKALETSVHGITQRKANWNASQELKMVGKMTRRLDVERKEQARLRHELRICRETDIYQHSNVFGRYSGTLQQIAIQINQERDRFQWFLDRPINNSEPSVTSDALLKMAQIQRKLTPELLKQLKLPLFPHKQLIQPNEFCRLVDAEKKANLAHEEAKDKSSYPGYSQLSILDSNKRAAIKKNVEAILATQDNLFKHFHSWAKRAAYEIAGDQDRAWQHILDSSVNHIKHI